MCCSYNSPGVLYVTYHACVTLHIPWAVIQSAPGHTGHTEKKHLYQIYKKFESVLNPGGNIVKTQG